jgi:diaminopimelate decarboxylase
MAWGGVPLPRALAALRTLEPDAHAFYAYDVGALEARARRFQAAFAPLEPLTAFALKANGLPALLEALAQLGLGSDSASLGELTLAEAAGFDAARRVLNGNGKTREEVRWAATRGVHSVNADGIGELDLLEAAARDAGTRLRVALRVNPGIPTPGHPYISTGDDEAKFGIAPDEALAAWSARARWPHLALDGVHIHVDSQLLELTPLERARRQWRWRGIGARRAARFDQPRRLRRRPECRGRVPARSVRRAAANALEWSRLGARPPLARGAGGRPGCRSARGQAAGKPAPWCWRGMNDFLRPALYRAAHPSSQSRRRRRSEPPVVGPVCESSDVLPWRLVAAAEPGDLVAIRDAGRTAPRWRPVQWARRLAGWP